MSQFRSILFLSLAGLACRDTAAPPTGVSVNAVVSPTVVAPGQLITITVRISNTSANAYRVPGSAGQCIATFEVRGAASTIVPASDPRVCDAVAAQHPLLPGSTLDDGLAWRVPAAGLHPGKYRIRGSISVVDYGRLWSETIEVEIRGGT